LFFNVEFVCTPDIVAICTSKEGFEGWTIFRCTATTISRLPSGAMCAKQGGLQFYSQCSRSVGFFWHKSQY
jgi:hypothetical protein